MDTLAFGCWVFGVAVLPALVWPVYRWGDDDLVKLLLLLVPTAYLFGVIGLWRKDYPGRSLFFMMAGWVLIPSMFVGGGTCFSLLDDIYRTWFP